MLKTIIVLPDRTEIYSGTVAGNAIQSCTFTECVNSGTELTLGSVCAAMAEIKLFTPEGGLQIAAGDELTIYQEDGNTRRKLGVFIAEKPTRPSANTMKLTAYDRVCKLDKDLTQWLAGLTEWPYSLYDFAVMVCNVCGLKLSSKELPNGSYPVQMFSADGITGRQLMQWIGEAAGRFCRATAAGELEFAWYAPIGRHTLGPMENISGQPVQIVYAPPALELTGADIHQMQTLDGPVITSESLKVMSQKDGTLTLTAGQTKQHFYYQGGLTFADYQVAPVEKVQIRANAQDVGVIWPDDVSAVNTYRITGNLLLVTDQPKTLESIAQTLCQLLQEVTYTPCTVSMQVDPDIRAGHILSLIDGNGKSMTVYVMNRRLSGQKMTLECTGSISRDSVSAVNEQSFTALSGKVLNLRTDVDGILAENKAADGRMASLELNVDGLQAQVEKQTADADGLRTELTQLQQTADAVQITVQNIRDDGVSKVTTGMGYTFDDEGLKIAQQDDPVENVIDNTGMYVKRQGETVLQANDDGVTATDVKVQNFLILGNSRLEPYENNRTACFYFGG